MGRVRLEPKLQCVAAGLPWLGTSPGRTPIVRTAGPTARRTRSALFTVCVAATALVASTLGASLTSANPTPPPASFTLAGAGFGHGVGMSQYGSLAMAKAGMDASSIVTHYYQGTNVTPVPDDMAVRVNLEFKKKHIRTRGEAVEGDGTLQANLSGTIVTAAPGESFAFTGDAGAVVAAKVVGGVRQELGIFPSVSLTWSGLANVVAKNGSFNSAGHRYRYGTIEILPTSNPSRTRLNVVNSLRLHEEYLYGISEVSSSWPDAALQAQVLAARTYALSAIAAGPRKACDCHVDDGRGPYSDQVFSGWSKQSGAMGERWVAAVNATHTSPTTGMAILYEGQPIRAFYSSSSGGATQASVDQWGGDLPYVRSVADPWSLSEDNPNRSWTVTVDQARMAQAFAAAAVQQVDVIARDPSGVAKTVQATLVDGTTVTKSGNQVRNALGLKSSYINAIDGRAGVPISVPQAPPAQTPPTQAPVEQPVVNYERQVTMLTPADREVRALKPFTIRAQVSPERKGLRVWFQRMVDGEWVTFKKKRTRSSGKVRYRVPEAWPPNTTQEYRVVVVRKKQPIGVGDVFRVSVVPSVKPRSVALITPSVMDVPAGKPFAIKAKVRPKRKGLTVWRQAFVDGEWRTVQRSTTKKGGRVVFRVKKAAPAGATYTYRILVVAKKQAAGASQDVTVNVSG